MSWIDSAKKHASEFWDTAVLGNTPDSEFVPSPLAAERQLEFTGFSSILPYDQYDDENHLFYNDTSIGFVFEVMPQTGADEDMASRLQTIFTPIPPGYGIQWVLFGSPDNEWNFQRYIEKRQIAVDNHRTPEFFLELAKRRIDYLRRGTGKGLFPDDNFMIRNFRLLFSITKTGTKDDGKLVSEMVDLRASLRSTLNTAHLPSIDVDAEALINFLRPILDPRMMFKDGGYGWQTYDDGKSIKKQITPFGNVAKVHADGLTYGLTDDEGEPIETRAYSVMAYPRKKELWEMANIIGALYDNGLQYPCPFLITEGVFTLDPLKVENHAFVKAARAKTNAKSKMAEYQPQLTEQDQDWQIATYHLNNGGRLCDLYHNLVLFAPKERINRCESVAVNIWKSERFTLYRAKLTQLACLYASLPLTFTKNVHDDLEKFRFISRKTTQNAVDLAPVLAEWKGAGDPILQLFGRRGSSAFIDFYSNKQGNYNVFVAGVSGSGKSVTMNEIVQGYRSIGAQAWVIDVGMSYKNLVALQKGQFIQFSPSLKICMNPFSWVGIDNSEDFKEELKLLKPMIGRMASPNEPLSDLQYSYIAEAITAVWKDYGQETNPTLISKFLCENIKNERGEIERISFELGKMIQPFTVDGMYGQYFNGKANISLDADMIGLELEELKNAPDLRRVVLFVLTSRIAAEMYLSRSREKICLIDEAWQLLGGDKETAEFIEDGYRRARKYKGIFCVGTQGIADAFKNDASYAAWNNADWKIYLRQDKKVLQEQINKKTISFSPATERMLLSLQTVKGKYSEMLISSPDGEQVLRHAPDPYSLLMASSAAEDFEAIRQKELAGLSIADAMTAVLRERGQLHY